MGKLSTKKRTNGNNGPSVDTIWPFSHCTHPVEGAFDVRRFHGLDLRREEHRLAQFAQCDRKYAWPKQRKKKAARNQQHFLRISYIYIYIIGFSSDVWNLEVFSAPQFWGCCFCLVAVCQHLYCGWAGNKLISTSAREWDFINFIPDVASSRPRCHHATASATASPTEHM